MPKSLLITSMVNAAEFAVRELGQINTKSQVIKFRDGFRFAWRDAESIEPEDSSEAINYRNRHMRLGALLGFTSFIMAKELKRQGHIVSKSRL